MNRVAPDGSSTCLKYAAESMQRVNTDWGQVRSTGLCCGIDILLAA